ncbi:MAG: MAPEG family protein [Methylophilaceae bacterium]|uniref:MAPEG family protein n=1 Tax=Methylovorus sp. MM2 TaxID=1848038 RepID=UPI0007E0FCA0|nr:MAPEG family protein [Methylovorus sp. MM2]OAM51499.1 hypothetical protein A7981_08390 [Methylovorus sp. MM2]
MAFELQCLTYALILGLVHILVAAQARTNQYGPKWNVSARDGEQPPLNPLPARLLRAQANFFETFPIFAVAILIAMIADRTGTLTYIGAIVYLIARVIYFPLYAFGVPVVRTIVWMISMAGICCVLVALF